MIARALVVTVWSLLVAAAGAADYEPTWASLARHEAAPEWFRDAKFGIYFHWGVYSVPAYGSEWYPRNMHLKGNSTNRHHLATYGEPTAFGYPDFIPRFTAEKFNAEEWAELFRQVGARFAGPVAEHHDGFAMWASRLTPWNAAAMGPRRDLVGELEKAIRARGMRFVTTFHHDFNNLWEKNGKWDGFYAGVKLNYPTLLDDPRQALLYGYLPREQFLQLWLGKLKEVIDAYRPDLIWHDSWMDEIAPETQREYLAYYFNRAREWGREVLVTVKQHDLPVEIAVEDFEKGRADQLTELPWLTDDTISRGSWCYTEGLGIKDAGEVIRVLADIVSKNGQLLLNISPKADGTIPDDQRATLHGLGDWLKTCGEAIYDTRPWLTYGEGPTQMKKGGHFVGTVNYTAEDIRYTRSKDGRTLYAICLGWPAGDVTLRSVKVEARAPEAAVSLLGHGPVAFAVNAAGQPVLSLPALAEDQRPSRFACAFRLTGLTTSLHPDAALANAGVVRLEPGQAVIDGEKLAPETFNGVTNLGFWDDPAESAHWLVRLPRPGQYVLRGSFASLAPTRLIVELAGQSLIVEVPPTGNWRQPQPLALGTITVARAGVYHLVLKAADKATWRAVNVYGLQVSPSL